MSALIINKNNINLTNHLIIKCDNIKGGFDVGFNELSKTKINSIDLEIITCIVFIIYITIIEVLSFV